MKDEISFFNFGIAINPYFLYAVNEEKGREVTTSLTVIISSVYRLFLKIHSNYKAIFFFKAALSVNNYNSRFSWFLPSASFEYLSISWVGRRRGGGGEGEVKKHFYMQISFHHSLLQKHHHQLDLLFLHKKNLIYAASFTWPHWRLVLHRSICLLVV